ncbi:hypothetical protein Gohar_014214 [Gossypium harknessii]|uniref:ClpA/ClpB AAA lid domain-containing protein n=1 Tax=Gossypium harknessii TaxID=34285 RepID=A0A7J9H2R0_9ROSI|nr:hypothetical protein [Gossypium harknessii]
MPNWEEWDPCEGDEQASKFPAFKLEIYECGRLVVSISCFSSLCELIIDGCEELVDEGSSSAEEVTSLKSMFLRNISKFDISAEKALLRFANSDAFDISVLLETEEEILQLDKIPSAESLVIRDCERLNRLPEVLHAFTFLTRMRLGRCRGLVYFVETIDLIDEAGSRVRLRHAQLPEEAKDLEKELWQLTKAQITAIQEKDKEMNKGVEGSLVLTEADIQHIIEETLHKRVVGQDEAVKAISRAIRRARVGLKNPNRPIASFIFSGPTGVGKSELAKNLQYLVDEKENNNMSMSSNTCLLEHLDIKEGIGMTLPPSLTSIFIQKFENLECMWSMGFQHLTSLQQLQIYTCPKLTSLPEKDMLLSLEHLLIYICPLLEEGCSRGKVGEWSKVAHIPYVQIVVQTVIPMGLD